MNRLRILLALPGLALGLLLVSASAAVAADGPEEKIVLFDTSQPHDVVGVLILSVVALAAGAAALNAWKQLRGERDQTDGKFRWR